MFLIGRASAGAQVIVADLPEAGKREGGTDQTAGSAGSYQFRQVRVGKENHLIDTSDDRGRYHQQPEERRGPRIAQGGDRDTGGS